MNILILNWRDPKNPKSGGAEYVTLQHAKAWRKKGNGVVWFSASFQNAKEKEYIDGVEIFRRGSVRTVYFQAAFFYLFSGQKFDVVVDEFHGIPYFSPLYVRVPVVGYIHEVAGKIWDVMYPFPINWVGKILEKVMFRFYTNVPFMVSSESTIKELAQMGVRRDQCSLIYCCIDVPSLKTLPKKESAPTFIFTSRLVAMKGIERVIEAFYLIQKSIPSAMLWVVGEGERDYLTHLKSCVARFDIKKKVMFFGYLAEEEKLEKMRSAHVFLHASVKEGWGLVILEAASQATPSVVYNVGGLRDVVQDGKTGIVIRKNTPEELAREAVLLIENKVLYKKMQDACLSWQESFSWEKETEKSYQVLLESVKAAE
ncbi:MAG: glycosyltransferase family 4 protein [bacterium]|nr:glycosyltransferase family 4 protein [bacterium]